MWHSFKAIVTFKNRSRRLMMNMRVGSRLAALFLLVAAGSARAGLEAAEGVMRLVPGDAPLAAVFADMDKLDKTILQWGRRIDPDAPESSPLTDLRSEIAIAEWVDFSKPMAIASLDAQGGEPVVWAVVPGFAEKIAAHEGAKNVEGVWEMPAPGGEGTMYLKALSDGYVVGASSRAELDKATKQGPTLADELKPRAEMFAQRDFVLHVNISHYRDSALAGIAQAAPMVVMMGGMMAAQGGDVETGANIQAALSAALDASKKFMEQLAYVDVVGSMDAQEANITLATGFNDGPIRTVLKNTPPASIPLLTSYEEQPYFMATGFHAPGAMGAMSNYFLAEFNKAKQAAAPPPAPPAEGEAAADAAKPAEAGGLAEAMRLTMEMNAMTEGGDTIIAIEKDGMRMFGQYMVKDASKYATMLKQSLKETQAGMAAFGGGMEYELLGSTKIGDVDVEQFTIKFDEPDAQNNMGGMGAPDLSKIYGKNTRYGVGVMDGKVRYGFGTDSDLQKAFTTKTEKSFASGRYVEAAMNKLPAKRSGVLLMDLAGMAYIMEMFGQPMSGTLPPGPPFALSFSLSGEPARVDIHIPLKAIERAMQAFSPQQPM
jgi:hypothetical protein